MKGKRIGLILALLMLGIITAAWIDGGEVPLHPIEEPVELPEDVR